MSELAACGCGCGLIVSDLVVKHNKAHRNNISNSRSRSHNSQQNQRHLWKVVSHCPYSTWSVHFLPNQSRTCELAKDYPHLLSSRQCTREEEDSVTKEMCIHSEEEVISDIRSQIYLAEETDRELPKTIFVATDHVAMEEELQTAFPDIKIVTWGPDLDQMDLYILNQADHVILNCVSAYSAYVKRDRDVNEKSVAFFGYMETHKKLPKVKRSPYHEEL